jgi:hypothetical protein
LASDLSLPGSYQQILGMPIEHILILFKPKAVANPNLAPRPSSPVGGLAIASVEDLRPTLDVSCPSLLRVFAKALPAPVLE